MPQATNIGWCDFTSSPIRYRDAAGKDVWGCVRVSRGCERCYAATLARRWQRGPGAFTQAEMETFTPELDYTELHKLVTMKKLSGKRMFMQDMTDWMGGWIPSQMRIELMNVMRERPDITFQMLTKRDVDLFHFAVSYDPMPNIWLGVSVEDRPRTTRIRAIYELTKQGWQTFISAEPLLDDISIELESYLGNWEGKKPWVIVGGESGPNFRPMDMQWAERIFEVCAKHGAPCFFKQISSFRPGIDAPSFYTPKEFPA